LFTKLLPNVLSTDAKYFDPSNMSQDDYFSSGNNILLRNNYKQILKFNNFS